MRLRTLVLGIALVCLGPTGHALVVGQCEPEAVVRNLLSGEGYQILPTPTGTATPAVWFARNDKEQAYVLRQSRGEFCLLAALSNVASINQSDVGAEVCHKSDISAEAKGACERLSRAGFIATGSFTALARTSSLRQKLTGSVTGQFVTCKDRAGKRVLCAIAETAQSPR